MGGENNMRIPEKVKIGGLVYDVSTVERLSKGDTCSAEIDFNKTTIEISSVLSPQRAKRDFLHEVTHAVFDNLGYSAHNEKEIDEIAGSLYQIIVDNPKMFEK